jgi:hypothetical protein
MTILPKRQFLNVRISRLRPLLFLEALAGGAFGEAFCRCGKSRMASAGLQAVASFIEAELMP